MAKIPTNTVIKIPCAVTDDDHLSLHWDGQHLMVYTDDDGNCVYLASEEVDYLIATLYEVKRTVEELRKKA